MDNEISAMPDERAMDRLTAVAPWFHPTLKLTVACLAIVALNIVQHPATAGEDPLNEGIVAEHAGVGESGGGSQADDAESAARSFLETWVDHIGKVYSRAAADDRCKPNLTATYFNGLIEDIELVTSCGAAADDAAIAAILTAPQPPMPAVFANQRIPIKFFMSNDRPGPPPEMADSNDRK